MNDRRILSDKYLSSLWSKAVRAEKGLRCVKCGTNAHSVHHIIKRRYMVLRYDPKNGVPLCTMCHPIADRNTEFAMQLIPDADRGYLADMGMYTLKDWLQVSRQSRAEFLKGCADELKGIIKG